MRSASKSSLYIIQDCYGVKIIPCSKVQLPSLGISRIRRGWHKLENQTCQSENKTNLKEPHWTVSRQVRRNSPVKHPTDKKKEFCTHYCESGHCSCRGFFNAVSMILKLSSCAYRKSKGFRINWDLGIFSFLLLTSLFQFCLSAHFSTKIRKESKLMTEFLQQEKKNPIGTGNF